MSSHFHAPEDLSLGKESSTETEEENGWNTRQSGRSEGDPDLGGNLIPIVQYAPSRFHF
jgi:hypothetical protein